MIYVYMSHELCRQYMSHKLWMSHELSVVVALIDMSPELIDMSLERGL